MSDPILKDLATFPRHAYPFLWADYVELLALCSLDGCYSRGDLIEARQEGDELQGSPETDEAEEVVEENSPDADDRVARRWDDIHRRLEQRNKTYAYWPFELRGNVLYSRFDPANPGHRLYAALLIAASYRLCSQQRAGEVAAALEELAYLLMEAMLGESWAIKPFGAHQAIADGYKGSLRSKLELLAADVHGTLMKDAESYDSADTGDGGIDVVAWDTLGDARGHMPVIFAQCGCSPTDWEHKQLSVTPSAVEAHISTQHPAAAWYVTPHDLAYSATRWDRESHVVKVVLLDRRRLLHLAKCHQLEPRIPSWPFVAEAASLNYRLTA